MAKIPSRKFPSSKTKFPSRKLAQGTAKIASRQFSRAPEASRKKTDASVPLDRPFNEDERQDRLAALKEKVTSLTTASNLDRPEHGDQPPSVE
jgi:hypothetical protein